LFSPKKDPKMITKLEDFRAYSLAMEIAEDVWNIVVTWRYFEKDTVGKQFVRAVDSIASNLAEGLGRYHYKEAKNFAYYSRGSLYETKAWLTKANRRALIKEDEFKSIFSKLDVVGRMINTYFRSIGGSNDNAAPNA
jgi:four helix bundle protein